MPTPYTREELYALPEGTVVYMHDFNQDDDIVALEVDGHTLVNSDFSFVEHIDGKRGGAQNIFGVFKSYEDIRDAYKAYFA